MSTDSNPLSLPLLNPTYRHQPLQTELSSLEQTELRQLETELKDRNKSVLYRQFSKEHNEAFDTCLETILSGNISNLNSLISHLGLLAQAKQLKTLLEWHAGLEDQVTQELKTRKEHHENQ